MPQQLRTAGSVLGTIELGNTVPYACSDGEFKIAGRGSLIGYHDDTLRFITSGGEETTAAAPAEPLYPTAVRAGPRSAR